MTVKKFFMNVGKALAVTAFWIAIWGMVSVRINSEFLLPSPKDVFSALGNMMLTAEFWTVALTSLLRVVLAIAISLVIGVLLAVATERIALLNVLLSPMLSVIKSTPVASFIILALLWIKRDSLPVFITALIVVPIVWSNVSEGIREVDKSLVEVTRVYKFSSLKKLVKLYVPSVAPFFMAACRSSLGMAWKAGISAEVLSTPEMAIGTELFFSKTYLDTPALFAWTLVVIILSIVIEKLFVWGLEALGRQMRVMKKGDSRDKA